MQQNLPVVCPSRPTTFKSRLPLKPRLFWYRHHPKMHERSQMRVHGLIVEQIFTECQRVFFGSKNYPQNTNEYSNIKMCLKLVKVLHDIRHNSFNKEANQTYKKK